MMKMNIRWHHFLSSQKSNCIKKNYIYEAKSSIKIFEEKSIERSSTKDDSVIRFHFSFMAKELCRIYYYTPRVFHATYALRPPRKLYIIHHGAVQLSIPRRRLIALLAADNYRPASLADVACVSFLSLRADFLPWTRYLQADVISFM